MTPDTNISDERLRELISIAHERASDGVLLALTDAERMARHGTAAALRELLRLRSLLIKLQGPAR